MKTENWQVGFLTDIFLGMLRHIRMIHMLCVTLSHLGNLKYFVNLILPSCPVIQEKTVESNLLLKHAYSCTFILS